jgi:ubiquitin-protein ligase
MNECIFQTMASKRFNKDLEHLIANGEEVYWGSKSRGNQQNKNLIYHLLLVLEKWIPIPVIRDFILPKVQFPIRKLNTLHHYEAGMIIVSTIIHEKTWNIRFDVPTEFPFRSPMITLNDVSCFQLKNCAEKSGDPLAYPRDLLSDILRCLSGDQWSSIIRLQDCIEFLKTAIDVHYNLPHKSEFLLKAELGII